MVSGYWAVIFQDSWSVAQSVVSSRASSFPLSAQPSMVRYIARVVFLSVLEWLPTIVGGHVLHLSRAVGGWRESGCLIILSKIPQIHARWASSARAYSQARDCDHGIEFLGVISPLLHKLPQNLETWNNRHLLSRFLWVKDLGAVQLSGLVRLCCTVFQHTANWACSHVKAWAGLDPHPGWFTWMTTGRKPCFLSVVLLSCLHKASLRAGDPREQGRSLDALWT